VFPTRRPQSQGANYESKRYYNTDVKNGVEKIPRKVRKVTVSLCFPREGRKAEDANFESKRYYNTDVKNGVEKIPRKVRKVYVSLCFRAKAAKSIMPIVMLKGYYFPLPWKITMKV
jgi:hypothetical protein